MVFNDLHNKNSNFKKNKNVDNSNMVHINKIKHKLFIQ